MKKGKRLFVVLSDCSKSVMGNQVLGVYTTVKKAWLRVLAYRAAVRPASKIRLYNTEKASTASYRVVSARLAAKKYVLMSVVDYNREQHSLSIDVHNLNEG